MLIVFPGFIHTILRSPQITYSFTHCLQSLAFRAHLRGRENVSSSANQPTRIILIPPVTPRNRVQILKTRRSGFVFTTPMPLSRVSLRFSIDSVLQIISRGGTEKLDFREVDFNALKPVKRL